MDDSAQNRTTTPSYRQPTAVLLAACLLSAAGALLFNVMPAFLASAAERHALTPERIGWVGSSYGAGFAFVAATAYFWIARIDWRRVAAVATALAAAGLAVCARAQALQVVLFALHVAGLGCGALYTIGVAVVAENHDPDRAFGVKLAIETFAGVAMLVLLPGVIAARWGFAGAGTSLAGIVGAFGLLALRSTPRAREKADGPVDGRAPLTAGPGRRTQWLAWLGLGALLVSFGGIAAVWGYLAEIGPSFGLKDTATAEMVVGIQVANALSAVAAAVIGDCWGRAQPLAIAMLLALGGVIALAYGRGPLAYLAGALLTYGMLNIPMTYQMGLIASADATGRVAAQIPAAMAIGSAAAMAIVGSMLDGSGYLPLYAFVSATIVVALAAFFLIAHRLSK
jgi:predicted MFS family arabinose efflux permease